MVTRVDLKKLHVLNKKIHSLFSQLFSRRKAQICASQKKTLDNSIHLSIHREAVYIFSYADEKRSIETLPETKSTRGNIHIRKARSSGFPGRDKGASEFGK